MPISTEETDTKKDLNFDLAETMVEEMSPPTEVSQQPQEEIGEEIQSSGFKPFAPETNDGDFNPTIHATNPDGTPRKNKDGSYQKKRGRKPGQGMGSGEYPDSGGPDYRAMGKIAANGVFTLGTLIGGPEWQPITNREHNFDERKSMEDAWAAYLESIQASELPPWIGLAFVMAGYAIPRFTLPNTQTRVAKIWGWIRTKTGW